jgi:response regulator RpfG family c-di-GMP phosphodiesterase
MENSSDLVKVKISQLIRLADSFAGLEVHIPVSGKFIKLNYASEDFVEILRKLQQKGMEEVYLHSDDTKRVLQQLQQNLSAKTFYDPKTVPEVQVERLDGSMQIIKNVIQEIGVTPDAVKAMNAVNARALNALSESPSIFAFIKRFKQNCSDEFLRSIITSYITSLMIDQFLWRSDAVKEKAALASMLCDVLLEKEDFAILRQWEKEGGELPEKIRTHPSRLADALRSKRNLIPIETITIIEQHHELPNGKGFPGKIDSSRFNQLSTIFIVAQKFVELLFEEEFNYEKRLDMIHTLQMKYFGKNFEKSLDALIKVVE